MIDRGATDRTWGREGDGRPQPIVDVLERIIEEKGLGDLLSRVGALDEWADAVGPGIAAVTRPVEVRGDELLVETLSSAWLNELSMLREPILERVNERRTGALIGSVRFRLAEDPESLTRPAGRRHGGR